jgi:hypothetical protein
LGVEESASGPPEGRRKRVESGEKEWFGAYFAEGLKRAVVIDGSQIVTHEHISIPFL